MLKETTIHNRILSLDVFRGITMFLLMAEAAGVHGALTEFSSSQTFDSPIIKHLHHHPWNGLWFWDLIQPFFMFIVGVAMPFSQRSRFKAGQSQQAITKHIFFRCFLLFLFGTGLHVVYNGHLVFELWNVLTQLSFTILVTYYVMRLPIRSQIIISFIFLILADVMYRLYDPIDPFIKDQNFGSYIDMLLMGKINNGGGWVTINCISTAAHTIWGAVVGKMLMESIQQKMIIQKFIISGLILLVLGIGLDVLGITPIIKRIATSSFSLVSGGIAILVLAFFYWFVDMKQNRKWTWFFTVVGTNSIFIYLFGETIGHQWLRGFVKSFSYGIFGTVGITKTGLAVINSLLVLMIMWYLCFFLYKRKIFFKI